MSAYFSNNPVTLSLTSYTGNNENVATLVNNFPPLALVGRVDNGQGLLYDQYDSYIYDNVGDITQIFTVHDYNDDSYQISIRFASEEDDNAYVSDFSTVSAFSNGSVTLCNEASDCFNISLFISVSSSNTVGFFGRDTTLNRTVTPIKPLVVNFSRPPRVSPFNFEFRLAPSPITTVTVSPSVITTPSIISVAVPNFEDCPTEDCNTLGF